MSVVALMTDFGSRDHYVAAMKGMILQVDPKADLVDITHEINPQELTQAAFTLRHSFPYFPAQTVFVVVVDPTVGTSRRILAARYNNRTVLAPDNGVLTFLHRDAGLEDLRSVENRQYFASALSTTFHGRDIFAPVAGHLSKGLSLDRLGPRPERIEILPISKPAFHPDGSVEGQVLHVDRFGNLITNISGIDLSAARGPGRGHEISVDGRQVGPLRITYADAPEGEILALIGSTQMLEIAANGGSAAQSLDARVGTPVHVRTF